MHIMLTTKLTSKLGLQTANYCSVAMSSISVLPGFCRMESGGGSDSMLLMSWPALIALLLVEEAFLHANYLFI